MILINYKTNNISLKIEKIEMKLLRLIMEYYIII